MPDEPLEAQEPGGEPAGRPAWLPDNFESPEELARSYGELRSRFTQETQARAEAEAYAAQLEETMQAPEPTADPYQAMGMQSPLIAQYQNAIESGDAQTQLAMTAYIANQIAEQKLAEQAAKQPQGPDQSQVELFALFADQMARDSYETKYGESWDSVRTDAAELLQTMPDLVPDGLTATQAAQRLMFAAEHVRGNRTLTGQGAPDNQQPPARPNNRLLSQTLHGAGTPPPATETDEDHWNAIKSAPVGSYSELRGR